MSSPTPRTRPRSDSPDRHSADREPGGRTHTGAHRLQRHGAWLARLGAATLVLLLAGLIAAWFTGALPLRQATQTDETASDVPIRMDPSASASGEDKASRDDRGAGSADPKPSDKETEDESDDDPPPPDEDLSEMEQLAAEAVRLTNVERERAGCGDVKVNGKLTNAAVGHSEDMAENDYFDHNSQDGRTPWDRARNAGYDNAIGENIAAGYTSAAAVIEGWMNSEGHRANLLNCDAKAIGLGVASHNGGQLYWTQMFGSV